MWSCERLYGIKGDFRMIKIGCKGFFHVGVQFLHIVIGTVLMTFERGNIQELRENKTED